MVACASIHQCHAAVMLTCPCSFVIITSAERHTFFCHLPTQPTQEARRLPAVHRLSGERVGIPRGNQLESFQHLCAPGTEMCRPFQSSAQYWCSDCSAVTGSLRGSPCTYDSTPVVPTASCCPWRDPSPGFSHFSSREPWFLERPLEG